MCVCGDTPHFITDYDSALACDSVHTTVRLPLGPRAKRQSTASGLPLRVKGGVVAPRLPYLLVGLLFGFDGDV